MRPTHKRAKRKQTNIARLQAMFTDKRVGRRGKPFPPGVTVLPDGTRIVVETYH